MCLLQGRATETGLCCTVSSAGRGATHTTSCGPSASAPLPVLAGETQPVNKTGQLGGLQSGERGAAAAAIEPAGCGVFFRGAQV